MWVLAGLGNPGSQYDYTPHNIGFMLIDRLASQLGVHSFRHQHKAHIGECRIGNEKVFLVKPDTYVNLSGQALQPLLNYYDIPLAHLIVAHDDLALDLTKLKVKQGGSAGGHNGLRSIDQHLGADYWRIRMGIGHPGDKSRVKSYVLSRMSPEILQNVEDMIDKITDNIDLMLAADKGPFSTAYYK